MNPEEIQRINKFVNLWSIKTAKSLIKGNMFLACIFPLFGISICDRTGQNYFESIWACILVMYVALFLWGLYMNINVRRKQLMLHLFFAYSSAAFSLTFFLLFYIFLYKYSGITSKGYMLGAIIGYFVLFAVLFYYRYTVLIGKSKNKSGSPNYSKIGAITIGGIAVVRIFTPSISDFGNAFIALFVAYGFSVGLLFIYNYIIAIKYKDIIAMKE